MDIINKYFPELDELQVQRFSRLEALYRSWNEKINLVSRKDIDHLYEHHVLHSLAIARFMWFKAGSEILDIGTGGGFPGIPLAILMPEVKFHLVDGTLKKIKVVQDVAQQLELSNVRAQQLRVEDIKGRNYDFVVSRAVAELEQLRVWGQRLLKTRHAHVLPNGIIALKGGRIEQEIKALPRGEYVEVRAVTDWFKEAYFQEKFVVYLQG